MSRGTTIPLMIVLTIGGLIASVAAEIPEDLRVTANTWAFLASMGRRCETRLEWQGYAGVHEDVCRDFEAQYARISAEFSEKQKAFRSAARAIDASSSRAAQLEWDFFMQGFQASTEQVFKAMQHILFLK
jgi:hypothetical protein